MPPEFTRKLLKDPQVTATFRTAIVELREPVLTDSEYGYVFSKKHTGVAIFSNGQWFGISLDLDFSPLLSFLDDGVLDMLRERYALAVEKTLSAYCKADTDPYRKGRVILFHKAGVQRQEA